jgi:Ser-tRNA(Ala) deacylase AlaX
MVMVGTLECMCGGTHVKNTLDIRAVTATRIKKV